LLEFAIRQWIDPLAALRAELLIREMGAAVGAVMFAQPESFLPALLCHALMVVWSIRTAESWTPGNIVAAVVLLLIGIAVVIVVARARRNRD
jgi:hypothetical protein